MTEVTRILNAIEDGDRTASDKLLPLVYDELRELARQRLANEKPGQTLQATALVHEAYIRLTGSSSTERWSGRVHFFGAAAEAIRRILIEQARRKKGPRAGGDRARIELSHVEPIFDSNQDLLVLNDALERLEAHDRRAAELVKLRFFACLTRKEAAKALEISIATADKDWAYAKGWLQVVLSELSGDKS